MSKIPGADPIESWRDMHEHHRYALYIDNSLLEIVEVAGDTRIRRGWVYNEFCRSDSTIVTGLTSDAADTAIVAGSYWETAVEAILMAVSLDDNEAAKMLVHQLYKQLQPDKNYPWLLEGEHHDDNSE